MALRLAVPVKRFPRLSETFVLAEFLELRRRGVDVELFSISDPREPWTQPEAEALREEVNYDAQRLLRLLDQLFVLDLEAVGGADRFGAPSSGLHLPPPPEGAHRNRLLLPQRQPAEEPLRGHPLQRRQGHVPAVTDDVDHLGG